jgi:branched-chain amino acid transport system permease protein
MQLLVNTFASAALCLLVGLGYTLFLLPTRSFNLAFGAFQGIAAYTSYFVGSSMGFSALFAIPAGLIISMLLAAGTEYFGFRKIRVRPRGSWSVLIASIGLATVLQNLVSMGFGDQTRVMQSGAAETVFHLGNALVAWPQLLMVSAAIVLTFCFGVVWHRSTFGLQLRAVSCNQPLAEAHGIVPSMVVLISTAVGALLGGVAAILRAYDTGLSPNMGYPMMLSGIVAVIIGGLGSIRGLIFGSIALASCQNLTAYFLDSKWTDAVTYALLLVLLLAHPHGISGQMLRKVEV